jgi:serine/threonine-protein kinase
MSDTPGSSTDPSPNSSTLPRVPAPPQLLPPPGPSEEAPAFVGRFRIDGELGRGGMGVVYKGFDPDLNRSVAVKVLKPDLSADPSLGRRFVEEAQLAGQLQHPGVVPVYELGRLPDGRLFFVMKLVRGRTLADLLRERPSPAADLPRFLLLFEQACQTVAYAHARGVVHRDLKPSNVMVGAFGEVQVMDWGLAKVLPSGAPTESAPPPADAASAIRTARELSPEGWSEKGRVVGTPSYMPPEQALGHSDRLDARADVFGLGAMLCEVLTGKPPYGGKTDLELYRRAVLAELSEAEERLGKCGAEPELVRLALACLAPAPADRPADAAAVAGAVRAYLDGVQERLRAAELEKAAAEARTAEERKRRRLAVALAAVIVAALLAGGVAVAWVLWEHAGRAEKAARAEGEKAAAVVEAAEKQQSAAERRERATSAAACNDRGLALAAEGRLDLAVAEYRKAIDLQPDYAAAHNNLGTALATKGSMDEAAFEFGQALALQPDGAEAHNNLGALLKAHGKAAEAEAEYRAALRLQPDLPDAHTGLGVVLAEQGQAAEAEKEFREALRLKPDNPAAHYNLGALLAAQGKAAEAEAEYREALRLQPDDAKAHYNLGVALFAKGRTDEAVAEFRRALELRPDNAEARCNLGFALQAQGRFAEALAAFRRGHELGSKRPGWAYPSSRWVAEAERLLQLNLLLPGLLRGEAEPADAEEWARAASFCQRYKRRDALAARCWAEAFAGRPELKDDLASGNRYNAACAAALAGCGRGEDAARVVDADRARLRRQALGWLREDLAARRERLAGPDAAARPAAQGALRRWREDADLAGVRDAEALAQLPEAERDEWRKLWADVDALLPKAAPEK